MSSQQNLQRIYRIEYISAIFSILLLVIAGGIVISLKNHYENRFYPGIKIDNVSVEGKTLDEVKQLQQLKNKEQEEKNQVLTIELGEQKIASLSGELGGHRNYPEIAEQAYTVGRSNFFPDGLLRLINPNPPEVNFTSTYHHDAQKVEEMILELKKNSDQAGEEPTATLGYSQSPGSLKISPGRKGREIDIEKTKEILTQNPQPQGMKITALTKETSRELTPEEQTAALERAKKFVGKQMTFRADNVFRQLSDQELVGLLAFPEGLSDEKVEKLLNDWNKEIDRQPQDAEFEYDQNTLQVKKFTPPRKGLTLDKAKLREKMILTFNELQNEETKVKELSLPVIETDPQVTLDKTNTLGISERVAFGESQYHHSIPSRIHNVALTSKKINNIIIKPGEEFSFNKALGDVSAATGFKPAYVIKNGRTELGDGGGVCQVSTTLFRAALDGGLPITKRKAHSYRVSYYELNAKPGIDATVYTGEVDLRFMNDTGKHLLIHTQADSEKLYMTVEFYGTSDGRTAEIVDHKTWDFQPAPPAAYIDDPSLPPGRTRQIDFAASGIKASFKNIVKDKDGKVIREDEYYSSYRPWRAVYLRGAR